MIKSFFLLLSIALLGYCFIHHGFGLHAVRRSLDDGSITAAVDAKIAQRDPLALLTVNVSTRQGSVFLDGHVGSVKEKDELVVLAKQVEGVKSVENRLTLDQRIRTPSEVEHDYEIMASTKKLLLQEEGLRALDIHVDSFQGHVSLSGHTPTAEQAVLAKKLASTVPGVKEVHSRISVP